MIYNIFADSYETVQYIMYLYFNIPLVQTDVYDVITQYSNQLTCVLCSIYNIYTICNVYIII